MKISKVPCIIPVLRGGEGWYLPPTSPVTNFPLDYVACEILSSECYVKVNDASDFWNVLECCQGNIWFVKLPNNVLFFFLNAEAFFTSVNAKLFVSERCCGDRGKVL